MFYLLFTFYLALACLLVPRLPFVKKSGLSPGLLFALFLLKIFAGILIGWMSQKFYPQGNDYWGLNETGWDEYKMMISNPVHFIKDIFVSQYTDGYGGFLKSTGSYWNDIRNTLITKFIGICDLLSGGNYYINSLYFNIICFLGHIALYRVFIDIYRGKKWQVITGCFLLPSTLYFTSGIHKDLVVFTLLGFFCYGLYFSMQKGYRFRYLLTIMVSFAGILLIRNFVALELIPASFAFVLSQKLKRNPLLVFASVYGGGLLLLILVSLVKPSFQPVKVVAQKQHDFLELPYATSQLETKALEPNFSSLAWNAPQALNHSLLRPYFWEPSTKFLFPLAIELFAYQLLFVFMLIKHENGISRPNAFIVMGLFLAISLLLFTGYIVPNTGSIVRYRSIYLPFLLTPILASINWKTRSGKTH